MSRVQKKMKKTSAAGLRLATTPSMIAMKSHVDFCKPTNPFLSKRWRQEFTS